MCFVNMWFHEQLCNTFFRHVTKNQSANLLIRLYINVALVLMMYRDAESISKFGSGLFLLVQVILLLDFVHAWNENWVSKDEQFWCVYISFLVLALPLYILFWRSQFMNHVFVTNGGLYSYLFIVGTWLC